MGPTIDALPDELLVEIFQCTLLTRGDKRALSLTCRRFREPAQRSYFASVQLWSEQDCQKWLASRARLRYPLLNLDLSLDEEVVDKALHALDVALQGGSLVSLQLAGRVCKSFFYDKRVSTIQNFCVDSEYKTDSREDAVQPAEGQYYLRPKHLQLALRTAEDSTPLAALGIVGTLNLRAFFSSCSSTLSHLTLDLWEDSWDDEEGTPYQGEGFEGLFPHLAVNLRYLAVKGFGRPPPLRLSDCPKLGYLGVKYFSWAKALLGNHEGTSKIKYLTLGQTPSMENEMGDDFNFEEVKTLLGLPALSKLQYLRFPYWELNTWSDNEEEDEEEKGKEEKPGGPKKYEPSLRMRMEGEAGFRDLLAERGITIQFGEGAHSTLFWPGYMMF
ncbi:hypothetical protein T439DRAFT_322530 [Meredithblackwellia eburnea MCA 4105]